jgi:hypothetical protein
MSDVFTKALPRAGHHTAAEYILGEKPSDDNTASA